MRMRNEKITKCNEKITKAVDFVKKISYNKEVYKKRERTLAKGEHLT